MNIYDFKIADIKKRLFLADTFDTVQYNWTVSIKSAGCTLCKNMTKNSPSYNFIKFYFNEIREFYN